MHGGCRFQLEDVDMAFENFKDKQFVNGAKNLGGGILQLANAVQDCDVPGIGKIAQNMFTKIGDDTVASDIGEAVQLLVNGADVTHPSQPSNFRFRSTKLGWFRIRYGRICRFHF